MKMNGMKLYLAAMSLAVIATVSGCSTVAGSGKSGIEVTQEQMNKIVAGKSTKEDVLRVFGKPSRLDANEKTKRETWYYDFSQNATDQQKALSETTIVEFNRKGIVKEHYKKRPAGVTK